MRGSGSGGWGETLKRREETLKGPKVAGTGLGMFQGKRSAVCLILIFLLLFFFNILNGFCFLRCGRAWDGRRILRIFCCFFFYFFGLFKIRILRGKREGEARPWRVWKADTEQSRTIKTTEKGGKNRGKTGKKKNPGGEESSQPFRELIPGFAPSFSPFSHQNPGSDPKIRF